VYFVAHEVGFRPTNFGISTDLIICPMLWYSNGTDNDNFESMQYRQDVRHIAHYNKRKHSPRYTRCSENHNNTCAENRKIRGLKFDTLYLLRKI